MARIRSQDMRVNSITPYRTSFGLSAAFWTIREDLVCSTISSDHCRHLSIRLSIMKSYKLEVNGLRNIEKEKHAAVERLQRHRK